MVPGMHMDVMTPFHIEAHYHNYGSLQLESVGRSSLNNPRPHILLRDVPPILDSSDHGK
jgi:hypothetical protein